jgi:predicted membrane channel-forming protein YqfA (hemolysin III family)
VYGIFLAFIIYKENEQLGSSFYLGLGIILLAVVLQTIEVYRKYRKRRDSEEWSVMSDE